MGVIARARAYIYDRAIVGMTAGWYRAVLARLPVGAQILDVGIGTGAALLANADLLADRDLQVTGVDIDTAYIERCRSEVARRELSCRVQVHLESVYDHTGGPYDAIYFSGSFMLLPDPAKALRHVTPLLAAGALVYFTQTFQHARAPLLEWFKPLLGWLTSIDFGRVSYEPEFRRTLATGGLEVETFERLHSSARQCAVLVVARVREPSSETSASAEEGA